MVCGEQNYPTLSCCFQTSHSLYHSTCHCPISTSFLTTSRRLLQFSSPTGSAAGETSEGPSSPASPRGVSSQCSSNLPSPLGAPSKPGIQTWSLDRDLSSSRGATLISTPSPSALQDNSSQDTQSSGKHTEYLMEMGRAWNILL